MKRTISMFGALAVAAVGFLFAAPAANAQVTYQSIVRNGVTCLRHNGGVYPENGNFYSCSTDASYNEQVLDQARAILLTWSVVNNRLSQAPVEFLVFDDPLATRRYLSPNNAQGQPIPPTTQQLQQTYNDSRGKAGYSTYPPTTQRAVVVWKNSPTSASTYPAMPKTASLTDIEQTTTHEIGHNFDMLVFGINGTWPSKSSEFNRVVLIDQAFMDAQRANKTPNGPAMRQQYSYWLIKDATKVWGELFAETFADMFHPSYLPGR